MQPRHACTVIIFLAACSGTDGTAGERDGGGPIAGEPDAAGDGDSSSCGPWNCDGCCDGASCRPGDGDDECGAGGAACQACGRWGECSDAAVCELAAATRWDVVIESASVSPVNHGGTDWDGDGDLPDVYVRATLVDPASAEMRSERTAASEDLTPTWDQTLFADLPAGALEGMQIELWDSDGNADDSFGVCTAAVRLEDAAAGALELACPRSLASGTGEVPARAGWTLRVRLEPRSNGRPDAPQLERHAVLATTSEPGSCDITRTQGGEQVAFRSYDAWGREVRSERQGSDSWMWDCSGEDHCEVGGALPLVRRMEPGPFGWRAHVEEGDIDSRRVILYDSLGRVAARHDYDASGGVLARTIHTYTAMRKVERIALSGGSPEPVATTDFDQRGSPTLIDGPILVQKIDRDADGLPVRYRVTDSDASEVPVGTTWDDAYQGAGCAAVLAAEVTNSLVDR